MAIFIGDIVTNSAFTIGDYESLSILSFLTIFSSIQNISLQVLEITKSSLDEKALHMCDAEHTAPHRCQPDRSGTLDIMIDSSFCDRDMTISVAG